MNAANPKKRLPALLLALLLLAGCASAPVEDTPSGTPDAVTVPDAAPETPTEDTSPDAATPDDVPDTPDLPDAPDAPATGALLDSRQPADEAGVLWYLPCEAVESGLQQSICLFGGKLLLSGTQLGADGSAVSAVRLIDLQTGGETCRAEFADYALMDVQVCGDRIAVCDWADGRVAVLDETLAVVARYDLGTTYCAFYLSPDAQTAYLLAPEDGLMGVALATGEQTPLLDGVASLYTSNHCGTAVTFTCVDRATQRSLCGMVDLTDGTVAYLPFEGSYYNVCHTGGVWVAASLGEERTCRLGRTERPNAFALDAGVVNVSVLPDAGWLMTTAYSADGRTGLTLYSMDGVFLSGAELALEGAFVADAPVWSESDGGCYLLAIDPSGKDVLLFWDMTVPRAGADLRLERADAAEPAAGTAVSQTLYDRAAALGARYGLRIRIAEQTLTDFGDYLVEQEFHEANLTAALDAVESALAAYPDGFFGQLLYGDVRQLELHLCGRLHQQNQPEDELLTFTSFVGFAQTSGESARIVLDITAAGSLAQTLHHELFHLIDDRLEFDARLRAESGYSEAAWSALNPEGFDYAWTTGVLPASVMDSAWDVWFVRLYSRTYPREDRATIMEYAASGAEWMFVSAPQRQAKLEYLCRCIRDTFDTSGWPEQTVWEATLTRSRG